MVQPRCVHSSALPFESCSFCHFLSPESLFDLCCKYVSGHLEAICGRCPATGHYQLRPHVCLPVELCERLLAVRQSSLSRLTSPFLNVFRDRGSTRLKRVRLRDSQLTDDDLQVVLAHRLLELDVSHCPRLTHNCIDLLAEHGDSLRSLTIGDNVTIFVPQSSDVEQFHSDTVRRGYVLQATKLHRLTLKKVRNVRPEFYTILTSTLPLLTHLDLSNCEHVADIQHATNLRHLTSLVLYDVLNVDALVGYICTLTTLQHLDISQSHEEHGRYENATAVLTALVQCLPRLTSLDISGTNLAGRGVVAEFGGGGGGNGNGNNAALAKLQANNGNPTSDIPGLSGRMNNPFDYLGLYDTSHDACLRHDIPAKLIAGNANEEQILVAARAYIDRTSMLQKVLNELFHLLRFEKCVYMGQALNIVLDAMDRHLMERLIQISGSATLFYIVKGTGEELHNVVRIKRRIITALLNGMSAHGNDDTMMRNGCLTLCQFKIPADVLFDYERLVEILLHSVYGIQQESFVQRIGVYLLNSLACQVDGHQKIKLGELGAINKMICLISGRLDRGVCDDVLEVAWSTMWNVTDETPLNCAKFLEIGGMEYFLSCLEKFPSKEELLRNMMGLLGNVAEVPELRHYLVTPKYLSVFSELLDSQSDGIEVSYNAAGVISHIASDGPDVWTVEEPSRDSVLERMVQAIDRWDLNSQRNINYRSFEPILHLVKMYHTYECQKWAVWALANLTRVYPAKYWSLIEKEGGLQLLDDLIKHPLPPLSVKHLAAIVVENCRKYKEQEWTEFDNNPDR